jgi:hypothetical protein
MLGNNAGILTNAYPLTAEQISALEKHVFETQEIFAYLDEQNRICFTGPVNTDVIKELAWHRAYKLSRDDSGTLNKKVYKKDGQKSFYLKETFQKQSYDDAWVLTSVESPNFELADGYTLITSDNLIFEIKEI